MAASAGESFQAWYMRVSVAPYRRAADTSDLAIGGGGIVNPLTTAAEAYRFSDLKYHTPLACEGYTVCALSIDVRGARTNYAFLYWPVGHEAGAPEYVCACPTFESMDGEYRQGFQPAGPLLASETTHDPVVGLYIAHVRKLLAAPDVALDRTMFPTDAPEWDGLDHAAVVMLGLAVMQGMHLRLAQTTPEHVSDAYTRLIGACEDLGPAIPPTTPELYAQEQQVVMLIREGRTPSVSGQKLIPIRTLELIRQEDIALAAWRELALTRRVSDMALNAVSPALPMMSSWTFLDGTTPRAFETRAMADTFRRSEHAARVLDPVRHARRLASEGAGCKSATMRHLDAHLYESIEYAQTAVMLEPVTLMLVLEHVGPTLAHMSRDHNHAAAIRDKAPAGTPHESPFNSLDVCARQLFELSHAAHSMHIAGFAHTDLHSNNMTFQPPFQPQANAPAVNHDRTVYVVDGDPGGAFMFPQQGGSVYIIDHSRSILGPHFDILHAGEPHFAEVFLRDQVNRGMRTLHRYAPEFATRHQTALRAALTGDFEAAFAAICAVDFIAIGANYAMALSGGAPLPECLALCERLEDAARIDYLLRLESLITRAGVLDPAPPGHALLRDVFARWVVSAPPSPPVVVTRAYSALAPLTYSGFDYAKFPPWARADVLAERVENMSVAELLETPPGPLLERVVCPKTRGLLLSARARARTERLDGRAVASSSSWLPEP
jgi:hypothetical protein